MTVAKSPKRKLSRREKQRRLDLKIKLRKARRSNLPDYKQRITDYLTRDPNDLEPLRCCNFQHYVRYFLAAPNVVERAFRPCRACADDMIETVKIARDGDKAVTDSWGNRCRLELASTKNEYNALRKKITRSGCKQHFMIRADDDLVAVLIHPDADIGVFYDDALELLNTIYGEWTDPSIGGTLTTSGRHRNKKKGKGRGRGQNVSPGGRQSIPANGTPETSNEQPEVQQVTKTGQRTDAVPASMNPEDFVSDENERVVASMNPDDMTDEPETELLTEEQRYTVAMLPNDTPYSQLPEDVRKTLRDGRTTSWGLSPPGFMECAEKNGAQNFLIRGRHITWIPRESYKKFRHEVENYKPELVTP
jgi:hypothetical protein